MKASLIRLKPIICIFFSISLLVSCASTKTGMYGLTPAGSNIVFLLDVSGSMAGEEEEVLWKRETRGITDKVVRGAINQHLSPTISSLGSSIYSALNEEATNRLTKLAGAKRELRTTINKLSLNTNFTVITFSERQSVWRPKLVPATTENKLQAIAFLDEASIGPNTSIGKALEAALAIEGVDEIFLVTDGNPTDSSPSTILAQVHSLNANTRVRINAVGLGKDQDVDFLNSLATRNNGVFIQKLN